MSDYGQDLLFGTFVTPTNHPATQAAAGHGHTPTNTRTTWSGEPT